MMNLGQSVVPWECQSDAEGGAGKERHWDSTPQVRIVKNKIRTSLVANRVFTDMLIFGNATTDIDLVTDWVSVEMQESLERLFATRKVYFGDEKWLLFIRCRSQLEKYESCHQMFEVKPPAMWSSLKYDNPHTKYIYTVLPAYTVLFM